MLRIKSRGALTTGSAWKPWRCQDIKHFLASLVTWQPRQADKGHVSATTSYSQESRKECKNAQDPGFHTAGSESLPPSGKNSTSDNI